MLAQIEQVQERVTLNGSKGFANKKYIIKRQELIKI
jgi:HKD family nuclease